MASSNPVFPFSAKARAVSVALLVSFTPMAFGAPAFAQGAAQDDALTKRARSRFQEGVEAFDKGQYENARLSFMEAYALKKHPAVLLNLAQSCLRGGHPGEAARYFQQFIREAAQASAAQRADAEKGLSEARTKAGRVEIVAPNGTEISVANAQGDVKLGTAPFAEPIDVEPGTSILKGRAADGTVESVSVTVQAGQRTTAKFGPQSAPPAPVPVPVPTTPSTTTPPPSPSVPPPPPPPPVGNPETPPSEPPGAKKPSLFSPPKTMTPVYIGAGVGVLGLAGTIIFAASKGSAQSSSDDVTTEIKNAAAKRGLSTTGICTNPPTDFKKACQQLKDNNSAVDTNATLANVSVAVMIVGFVGAGAWYLFAPKKNAEAAATGKTLVLPMVGPQTGGMVFQQTF